MKLAAQNDTDRASQAIGQLDFSTSKFQQRQALFLFRQEFDCIVAEHMRCAAAWEQAHEAQREFLLGRMQMREQDAAVDLVDVHGGTSRVPISHWPEGAEKKGTRCRIHE